MCYHIHMLKKNWRCWWFICFSTKGSHCK